MPLIETGSDATQRRRPEDVLGITGGPSRRGSTYWGRVLACPRVNLLSSVLKWDNVNTTDPLTVGLMWHWALEAYYAALHKHQLAVGRQAGVDFYKTPGGEAERAAFMSMAPFADEPGYVAFYETIARMLTAYFRRYPNDRWEIVGVECNLESQFRKGFEYSARLDLLVVDHRTPESPMLRVIEHKSAGWINSILREGYTQDLQTLGQVWLAANEIDLTQYPPFVGSLVNITSKTKTVECERVAVQPSPKALGAWENSMRAWQALLPMWPKLGYPQNFSACTGRYGRCPFFDVCKNYPELNANDLIALDGPLPGYKLHNWDCTRE